MPTLAPESPCVNICSLDEHGLCRGCYRTIQEIAAWPRMTHDQQRRLLEILPLRTVLGA